MSRRGVPTFTRELFYPSPDLTLMVVDVGPRNR